MLHGNGAGLLHFLALDIIEQLPAHCRMCFYDRVLLIRQLARLLQDLGRNHQFADIVHSGSDSDQLDFILRKAKLFGQNTGILRHTLYMLPGLPGFVLRDLRKGHDDFFLYTVCFIRSFLDIRAILHNVREQKHDGEGRNAEQRIIHEKEKQPERVVPNVPCCLHIKRTFPFRKKFHDPGKHFQYCENDNIRDDNNRAADRRLILRLHGLQSRKGHEDFEQEVVVQPVSDEHACLWAIQYSHGQYSLSHDQNCEDSLADHADLI